jgi:hypothetical protein
VLPDATLPFPASLASLLAVFGAVFTAPSLRTFCGLACGFVAQTGKRTVCGMLAVAGLARLWSHDRAHRFFARARWDPDEPGLAVARLVVALLVPAGEPVTIAIDDTLFRRRGKKSGPRPGSTTGQRRTCQNGIRQQLGDRGHRGAAVPCAGPSPSRCWRLVIKDTSSASAVAGRRMPRCWPGRCPAGTSASWPIPPAPGAS